MAACFDRELCVDPFLVESDGFVDHVVTHSFLFEEVVELIACDRVGDDGRVWIFFGCDQGCQSDDRVACDRIAIFIDSAGSIDIGIEDQA